MSTFYVTKRGDAPYDGPAWKYVDSPRGWFDCPTKALQAARELAEVNPVGFSVVHLESTRPKGVPGEYPQIAQRSLP